MLKPEVFIRELEILIEQQVEYVQATASRWPDDGGAWDRLLERYGVSTLRDREHPPFRRGAPVPEVRQVLAAIRKMAGPALAHIEVQFGEEIAARLPLASWVSRLRARVYGLEDLASDSASSGDLEARALPVEPKGSGLLAQG